MKQKRELNCHFELKVYYIYNLMGHNVVEQNKRLVFIFIFITISEAYQTPGSKNNLKYTLQIK